MNHAAQASKRCNMRRILKSVIRHGEISRAALAEEFSLSTATVTNIVSELMEFGLLNDGRKDNAAIGRKAKLIRFNGSRYRFVGVVVPTDNLLSVFVCDLNGTVQARSSRRVEFHVAEDNPDVKVISSISRAVGEFIGAMRDDACVPLSCVAVSVPGFVNSNQTIYAPFHNWKNMPLAEPLKAETGLAVYMENVTRIKALSELDQVDPAERNILYLALSPGIGMVNFFNGKMVRGRTGRNGEVGHISLNKDGEACYCGNRGCFELYCGENFILKNAGNLLYGDDACPVLRDLVVSQNKPLSIATLFVARSMGSIKVYRLLATVAEYLGVALANIINCYDPDRILISGDIVECDSYVLDMALEEARSRIVSRYSHDLCVECARVSTGDTVRALCSYVLNNMLDTIIP